jgi:hypothetical protein
MCIGGYSTCDILMMYLQTNPMSRAKSIKIRLSEYEYQQLQQEAERQGTGMSDLLRKCISKFPAVKKPS